MDPEFLQMLRAKGRYFWYKVQSYDEEEDQSTLLYQKKAIDPEAEGANFYAFAEDTDDLILEEMDISAVKCEMCKGTISRMFFYNYRGSYMY